MDIIIVFSPHCRYFWQKFFKIGFAHVFILVKLGPDFILLDGVAPHLQMVRFAGMNAQKIMNHYHAKGCICLYFQQWQAQSRAFTPEIYNCVVMVKRVMGIAKPGILTPFQLYKYLTQ